AEAAWQTLAGHMEAARPAAAIAGQPQEVFLTLPASAAGHALRELGQQPSPVTPLTVLQSSDDVMICYEAAGIPVREAAQSLLGGDSRYAALAEKVWTRTDVAWGAAACP